MGQVLPANIVPTNEVPVVHFGGPFIVSAGQIFSPMVWRYHRLRSVRRARPRRLQRYHFSKVHPGKYRGWGGANYQDQSTTHWLLDKAAHLKFSGDKYFGREAMHSLGGALAYQYGREPLHKMRRTMQGAVAGAASGYQAVRTLHSLGFSSYDIMRAGFGYGKFLMRRAARRR